MSIKEIRSKYFYSTFDFISFIILFFVIFPYRLFNPFEEDQKIFFSGANIAFNKFTEHFPQNLFNTFELKPFNSKLVYYIFYNITNQFINFNENKLQFIISLQFFFNLISFIITFLFVNKLKIQIKDKIRFFFLINAILILVGSESFFQVEHIAILLSILAIYFSLSSNKIYLFIAGIIFGFIGGLKGITICYSIAAMFFIYYKEKKLSNIILFSFFITFFISIYISWIDLKYAKLLQGNNFNLLRFFLKLIGDFKFIAVDQTYIISLFIFLFYSFINNNKKLNNFIYIIFIVIIPSIILQVGFSYHFFGLSIFFILALSFFYENHYSLLPKKFYTLLYIYPIIFIYLIFSTKYFIPIKNLESRNKNNFNSEILVQKKLVQIINNDKEILYLTDGVINFYITNPSACNEYYPISINRLLNYEYKIPKEFLKKYNTIKGCIANYNGEFILLQTTWFPFNEYNKIYPSKEAYILIDSAKSLERTYFIYKKNKL